MNKVKHMFFFVYSIVKIPIMPFSWQINASAVGKLIGAFKLKYDPESKRADYQREALAKTWHHNLKRMPKFGVQPSTTMRRELAKRQKTQTTDEAVQKAIESSAEMKTFVHKAVAGELDQTKAIRAIEQKAKTNADEATNIAEQASKQAARAAEKVITQQRKVQQTKTMRSFKTVKAGAKKTRANGWFFVVRDEQQIVYHMSTTGRSAKKSTAEQAQAESWVLPTTMKVMREKVVRAVETAQKRKTDAVRTATVAQERVEVARNIRKVATSTIQTTKGNNAEDKDLQRVQKSQPSVRQGNRKAYFYRIFGRPHGAFIIGYIDGFDTKSGTVIELKHRSRGLFKELREYERVQCFVYMKMLKTKRAKLIETYEGEQREYVIEWDDATWRRIEKCIVQVVCDLNRAEQDVEFRNELLECVL